MVVLALLELNRVTPVKMRFQLVLEQSLRFTQQLAVISDLTALKTLAEHALYGFTLDDFNAYLHYLLQVNREEVANTAQVLCRLRCCLEIAS